MIRRDYLCTTKVVLLIPVELDVAGYPPWGPGHCSLPINLALQGVPFIVEVGSPGYRQGGSPGRQVQLSFGMERVIVCTCWTASCEGGSHFPRSSRTHVTRRDGNALRRVDRATFTEAPSTQKRNLQVCSSHSQTRPRTQGDLLGAGQAQQRSATSPRSRSLRSHEAVSLRVVLLCTLLGLSRLPSLSANARGVPLGIAGPRVASRLSKSS